MTAPWAKLRSWFRKHAPQGVAFLASTPPGGMPSSRAVLLLGQTGGRLAFLASPSSRKARELAGNPRASLLLYAQAGDSWPLRAVQLRIEGRVESSAFHGLSLFLLNPKRLEFWEGMVPGSSKRERWIRRGQVWSRKIIVEKGDFSLPKLPYPLAYPFEK